LLYHARDAIGRRFSVRHTPAELRRHWILMQRVVFMPYSHAIL